MPLRWRYTSFTDSAETAKRELVVAKIQNWWRAFENKSESLNALFAQPSDWDLPGWMEENLETIHSRLMWEFGPAVRGEGHRLVITPESAHHLQPLVDAILRRAPQIDGWEFYDHRLAESLEMLQPTVDARVKYDVSELTVHVSAGAHNLIDLLFAGPKVTGGQNDPARGAAFVVAETLLGEECLNKWIGTIDVEPRAIPDGKDESKPRANKSFIPLARLKDTVDAVAASIVDQLPDQPHYQWIHEAAATLWKLQPEEQDDYAGQDDLYVGRSANPEAWMAAHSSALFYSERFSRCGETFCFVKLDGTNADDRPERFQDKAEIEDALDGVLTPAKAGCTIGGGTGLRYSYIDLALTDVERAIPLIRDRLREGNVPKRSWIQFFDSCFASEWIGIYDDSPPPQLAVDD